MGVAVLSCLSILVGVVGFLSTIIFFDLRRHAGNYIFKAKPLQATIVQVQKNNIHTSKRGLALTNTMHKA